MDSSHMARHRAAAAAAPPSRSDDEHEISSGSIAERIGHSVARHAEIQQQGQGYRTPSRVRREELGDEDARPSELQPLTGGSGAEDDGEASDGGGSAQSPDSSRGSGGWHRPWRRRRSEGGGGGGSPVTENCLVILTAYSTIIGLFLLQSVMVPLVTALFISTLLLPMLDLLTERPLRCCRRTWCPRVCKGCLALEKRYPGNCCCSMLTSFLTFRLPNALALVLVVGTMLGFFFLIGMVIQQSIVTFTTQLPLYESAFQNESTAFLTKLDELQLSPTEDQKQQVLAAISEASRVTSVLMSVLQGSTEALAFVALVMLYVVFILLGSKTSRKREKHVVLYTIERQLQLYITLKVAISTLCGVTHAFILRGCGVDLAAVFGVLTFLLNFIPTVGLLIAVVLPLPIIYLAPTDGYSKLLALVAPYAMSFAVSNFVEPSLFGNRLNLHPVVVLFALVFWNMLWGITGALLSVPIISATKIILINMQHPTAQWTAALLEGAISIDAAREARAAGVMASRRP